jgi:diguanylate cyclase (GGDEF)-like protein/PAS domain S-box-containing protein
MDADRDDGGEQAQALDALLLAPVVSEAAAPDLVRDRLRRRETALRAVLEGLPDATVAASADGLIVFVNTRAEELFGYRSADLVGRPVSMLWAERVRERYTRNMRLYFATEHPLRFSTNVLGVRSDGSEFVGEMSWGIVETEAGPLLLAIGRDISERRAAMSRLRRQSDQQAAVAALGERALAGADEADLAAEAAERVLAALPVAGVEVRAADAPGGMLTPRTIASAGLAPGATGSPPGEAVVPIGTPEAAVGELVVAPADALDDDAHAFLRAVANVLAGAMARQRGEERMRHEALHDPLTGLANRTLCRDRIVHALARAGRADGAACVFFIDLDAFKRVNDLYGHAAGDALLVALSRRLVATVRPADTVARLGGDEFVVVCEDIDEDTAIALGHRLAEAIAEPLDVDGVEHRLSASIGIALGTARRDPDALLGDADAAAYRAKAEGRGRVEVFDRRLRRHARERLRTAEALEQALSLGQLRLAFQPIVALADGGVVGQEALLRWDRPGGGVNAPADFIPVAEESALIVEIGAWALRRACVVASGGPGSIWVNVSGRQLAQPGLPELVADVLAETGLAPSRLRLELTEAAVQGATAAGLRALRELDRTGVGIVLDDFGTGYSSLGQLRDLPLTALKIDRTFVGALARGTSTVAAIASVAAALELDAVAEGVETEAQAEALRELGCPLAQGFLFGPPALP